MVVVLDLRLSIGQVPGPADRPHESHRHLLHSHILDTRKYAEDCERTFGYFLPYFGMRGEEDACALQAAFAATLDLVAAELGEVWLAPIATQCLIVTQCRAEVIAV